jgi:tyrosinase
MDRAAAQQWVDEFLTGEPRDGAAGLAAAAPEVPGLRRPFSPFVPSDVQRSAELQAELHDKAAGAETPEEVIGAVSAHLEESPELIGLRRHALKVFLSHDERGRELTLPTLEERAPHKAIQTFATLDEMVAAAETDPEAILSWFREDPQANEHHDHWHAVFPTGGVADPIPQDPKRVKIQDRQGELFFYMHEQMLARYDTERLAAGLARVTPIENLKAKMAEGYDPAKGLQGLPLDEWYSNAPPSARPPDSPWADRIVQFVDAQGQPHFFTLPQQVQQDGFLREAASTGKLSKAGGGQIDATTDLLGSATEPDFAPASATRPAQGSPDIQRYFAVHGMGHVLIASFPDPDFPGVMVDTDTAIRDPVFWRWHKHIDNLCKTLQERSGPRDFDQEQHPDVEIRPSDLILWQAPDPANAAGLEALRSFGAETFGGAHFDEDFASGADTTDTLSTRFERRPLKLKDFPDPPQPIMIDYLDQKPFAYAVRVANRADEPVDLVLRLFIVAETQVEERNMYIELDKFVQHLDAGEKAVAVRHASESSVIRKPGIKPPGRLAHSPDPPRGAQPAWDVKSYCTCGWPYNLLLPMGKGGDGMPFRLVAIATDFGDDQVTGSTCGSVSYCGAKDKYPDNRPMGYPFDRQFPAAGIAATFDARAEMAARPFRITCENPPGG